MSGHRLVPDAPGFHCYAATKYAVRAIAEGLRNELHAANTRIRVTVCLIITKRLLLLLLNNFIVALLYL